MAQPTIDIVRVDWDTQYPGYMVRCQQHGDVEKVAGKDAAIKAEQHNLIAHNRRAFVDVPVELTGKRYF